MINENKNKIILASNSPRRKEILSALGVDFDVYVPKGKEIDIIGEKYSVDLVNECAKQKAMNAYEELKKETISDELKESIIISCDTVVVGDGIIIGKPKDKNDAFAILKSLSGKTHIVSSSICIAQNGDYNVANEITKVTFRNLLDKEILDYIDRCKPFDKAGSYGIQDEGFDFVESIDGSYENVMGFPVRMFEELLRI